MTESERNELRELYKLEEYLESKGFTLNNAKRIKKLELEVKDLYNSLDQD